MVKWVNSLGMLGCSSVMLVSNLVMLDCSLVMSVNTMDSLVNTTVM